MEVRFNTLNFVIAGLIALAMDLDVRSFAEKQTSKSIYLSIFGLI
jgi:predicted membrane protein